VRKAEAAAHLRAEDFKNYRATHVRRSVSGQIKVLEWSRV
jgi:hypothetical protein